MNGAKEFKFKDFSETLHPCSSGMPSHITAARLICLSSSLRRSSVAWGQVVATIFSLFLTVIPQRHFVGRPRDSSEGQRTTELKKCVGHHQSVLRAEIFLHQQILCWKRSLGVSTVR